ncbi:MAG: response regulator [Magnetovibrionaceae bacterium]
MAEPARRLLICEREEAMRFCLGTLFRRAGFETAEAADGDAAVRAALANPPDLITLCVALEKRDGYDVLSRLRAAPELTATRFLVVSGQSRPADREKALALGADGFVLKPFDSNDLLAQVRDLLGEGG